MMDLFFVKSQVVHFVAVGMGIFAFLIGTPLFLERFRAREWYKLALALGVFFSLGVFFWAGMVLIVVLWGGYYE